MYSLSLNLGGSIIKSEGDTPTEALAGLKRPAKIMSKGVLTVSDGEKKREILLQPVKVKRLFMYSRGTQEVIAKQIFAGLK